MRLSSTPAFDAPGWEPGLFAVRRVREANPCCSRLCIGGVSTLKQFVSLWSACSAVQSSAGLGPDGECCRGAFSRACGEERSGLRAVQPLSRVLSARGEQ